MSVVISTVTVGWYLQVMSVASEATDRRGVEQSGSSSGS